jgi:phosphate acetyltransferase
MSNSIYVTATQRGSGKSTIVLGLINVLERTLGRVGYFKPICVKGDDGVDPDVQLMKESFGLVQSLEELAPVTIAEVAEALATERYDQLVDTILEAYGRIREESDFVVCEGTDYFGAMASFEFNINADLSKNLGSPILLVANAAGCTVDEGPGGLRGSQMIKNIIMVKDSFDEKSCEFFGTVINRAEPRHAAALKAAAQEELGEHRIRILGVIPRADMLERPRLEEVAAGLGATVIAGHERLSSVAQDILVAAMGLENVLARLSRGGLVLTPGDREDVLVGMAAAYSSPSVANPSGVVLTGGLQPRENVTRLALDITQSQMPIMTVESDTYETAIKINALKPRLASNQRLRIEVVKGLIERHLDTDPLVTQGIVGSRSRRVTPKQFLHRITELARGDRRRIVLPEGEEERVLRAAQLVLERKLCEVVLLGPEPAVRQRMARLDLEPGPECQVIDPQSSPLREQFARRYVELRAPKKTLTIDAALDLMADVSYFGTMMVQEGQADGMVSGSTHTTAHTLRPALEFVKTKEGVAIASSIFFMCLPDSVLVYGDCAVNPSPTAEELADIALASAETARAFEIEPYVAMLSYSTGDSGKGSDVDKVREATRIVKERNPALPVEGPIQYDAAVDPTVAKTKLPKSRVAGAASVFIFPDLNSGNVAYKAVQRSAHAIAVGPVMQGLRKPVNDLSRGCTVVDIVNTIAITAIQAQRS